MHSNQRERRPRVRQVGRYRLDHKLLGKGNFARVELATHTILGLQVAIKLIDKSHITEEYVRRNLGREARIMARLRHPHIAALYEAIESGHLVCLVTELAPGGDLCSYVKARAGGKLTEQQACPFLRQIVSALSYMHDRGILHRDLKMENVMLDETQTQTKIVDFGLSNFYGPGVSLMTHCGSPEYAAPELFVPGKAYGPQVDVWSLGIIMYGALTGCLPFLSPRHEGCSAHERRQRLYQKIQEGLGQQHWKALGNVSAEARHLLASLLDPDPEQRIPLRQVEPHPFITGNGRHTLPTNYEASIKDADGRLVLRRLSAILSVPSSVLEAEIERDDHCEVAAMFYLMLAALRKNKTAISNLTTEVSAWCAMASALNNNESIVESSQETPLEILTLNGPTASVKSSVVYKERGNVVAEVTPPDVIEVEPLTAQFPTESLEPLPFPDVEDVEKMVPQDKNYVSRDSESSHKTDSEETVTEDNGTIYDSCYDDDDMCRLIADRTPLVMNAKKETVLEEETAAKAVLPYWEKNPKQNMSSFPSDEEEPFPSPCTIITPPSPLPPPPPRRFTLRSLCFKAASDVELLAGDAETCRSRGKVADSLTSSGKEGRLKAAMFGEASCKKMSPRNTKMMDEDLESEESQRRWSKHKIRSFFRPKKNSTCLCMTLTDTKLFSPPSSGDCHPSKQTKSTQKISADKWLSTKWPHVCLMELLELHWRARKCHHCKPFQEENEQQQQQQQKPYEAPQQLHHLLGWHYCVRPLSAPASLLGQKDLFVEDEKKYNEITIPSATDRNVMVGDRLGYAGAIHRKTPSGSDVVNKEAKGVRKESPSNSRLHKRNAEKIFTNCQRDVNVLGRGVRLCNKQSQQQRPEWPSSPRVRQSSSHPPVVEYKTLTDNSCRRTPEDQGDARRGGGCTWRSAGAERGDGGGCAAHSWLDDPRVSSWLDSHVTDQQYLFIRGIGISRVSSPNQLRPFSSALNLLQRRRRFRSHDRSIDNRFRKTDGT